MFCSELPSGCLERSATTCRRPDRRDLCTSYYSEWLIDIVALCVPCQHVAAAIELVYQVRTSVEVVGGAEWAGFLDSSAPWIVAEGSGTNARIDDLRQPIFKIPGVGFAGGVGEGIAVRVIRALPTR